MNIISLSDIQAAVTGLGNRDFYSFSKRIAAIDPILGETVRLHVAAADDNSPDLDCAITGGWIAGTLTDATAIAAKNITSVKAAKSWWISTYVPY